MTKALDDVADGGKRRADEIEQEAAEWVARIDLRGTPEEWSALEAWLNASPRNRAAFLRLSVAWRRTDELKRLAPLGSVVDPDLLDPARWKSEPSDDEVLEGRAIAVDPHKAGDDTPRPLEHPATRSGPVRGLHVVASNENPTSAEGNWAATRDYRSSANDAEDMFTHDVAAGRLRTLVTSRLAASVTIF